MMAVRAVAVRRAHDPHLPPEAGLRCRRARAGRSGLPLLDALGAFLQAFASDLVQAAIRPGVVGQSDVVAIVAKLEQP